MSAAACLPADRERVARLLGARADDSISAVETRWLKTHLLSCPPCAGRAAAEDPTLLFVPISASAEGIQGKLGRESRRASAASAQLQAEADRVVADVLAAVEVERSRRRLTPFTRSTRSDGPRHRRALLAASIALAAAGLAGWVSWRSGGPARVAAVAALPAASTAVAPAVSVPIPASGALVERPVIEDLKNPGATVYEFASASPQEPTLVFIVDRNADI